MSLKLFLTIVILGMAFCLFSGTVSAEAIPSLKEISAKLPDSIRERLIKQKLLLEKELKKFLAAADQFNAKNAEDQNDAEFELLASQRSSYIAAATAFNQDVTSAQEINKTTPTTPFTIAIVKAEGEYCFELAEGRKLQGAITGLVPINNGTRVTTGATGMLTILLPDQTVFHFGPNSDMVIDEFVYDPSTSAYKAFVNLSKGLFRWVTGKAVNRAPGSMKVTGPTVAIGIRGTDFELEILPDGSGQVKLYSGELEVTPLNHDPRFVLLAKNMVRFAADGSFRTPEPLSDPVSPSENTVMPESSPFGNIRTTDAVVKE